MTRTVLTTGQRVRATLMSACAYPVIALLCRTLHWQVDGYDHYAAIRKHGNQPIFAFWHGRIFPATWFWREREIVVMTSDNFDGEWIARVIKRFGFEAARGSTTRGGARALAQLRRNMKAGKPAAFTLDGPRGPRQTAQLGAIWLSELTGNPILPFHIEVGSCWTANSWDRTQIPKPFSRVAVAIGEPIVVKPRLCESDRELIRLELERTLKSLHARTNKMLLEQ